MKEKGLCKEQVIFYIGVSLFVILVLGMIGLRCFVFFKYANTPIKDIPAWAYWIMQDNGKGGGK